MRYYLQFSGGKIAPAVVSVPSTATFSIDDNYDDSGYGWTLAAGTVKLAGQTDWNTPAKLVLGSRTTINNLSGAVFTIECDHSMTGGAFDNQGTLTKVYDPQTKTGKGTTKIDTSLSNTGSGRANSGTLDLAGNSTFAGPFGASSGTSIVFGGGTQIVNAGTVFSGPGTYVVNDGPSGSLVINTAVAAPESFKIEGGTIDMVDSIAITGRVARTGGTLEGSGLVVVGSDATLEIGPAAMGSLVNDAVLVNFGTVTWKEEGGAIRGTGTIDNEGTFRIDGPGSLSSQVAGSLHNSGTLLIYSAILTLSELQSTGTIDVGAATSLWISGNATIEGVIQVNAGSFASFVGNPGGTVMMQPGAAFEGPGSYYVGDTLLLETNMTVMDFHVVGGIVTGPGTLTVTNELELGGGDITPADINLPVGSTFSIDDGSNTNVWDLGAGSVNLAGLTVWDTADGGNLELGASTIVNNENGAQFIIQCNNELIGGRFNNLDTIIKDLAAGGVPGSGTATIVTPLNNAGSVVVDAGTLNLGRIGGPGLGYHAHRRGVGRRGRGRNLGGSRDQLGRRDHDDRTERRGSPSKARARPSRTSPVSR